MKNNHQNNCLNCGHPFDDTDKFCSNCGQKSKLERLTVKLFLAEFFNSFFGIDSKIKRTIRKTITKPGIVAKDFIEGKRQEYINPFRFYLGVSIIFFLLTEFITRYNHDYNDENLIENLNQEGGAVQINLGNQDSNNLDSLEATKKFKYDKEVDFKHRRAFIRTIKRFKSATDLASEYPNITHQQIIDSIGCEPTKFNKFLIDKSKKTTKIFETKNFYEIGLFLLQKLPLMLFFSLPFYALIFNLFYISKKLSLAEHMVFTFQYASLIFLILTLLLLFKTLTGFETLQEFSFPFLIFMFYRSLRNFYQQSRLKTLFKLVLMSFFFSIVSFLTVLFIFFVAFLIY